MELKKPQEPINDPVTLAVKDFAGITNVDVYSLSELQKEQIGLNIISASKDYLENEYGLDSLDIIDVFGSTNHPDIGLVTFYI